MRSRSSRRCANGFCKEIWVVGADRWRNPDEDLPSDFDTRRAQHYAALSQPVDPAAFIDELRGEMQDGLAALNTALPTIEWLEITARKAGAIRLTPLDALPEAAQPAAPEGSDRPPLGQRAADRHAQGGPSFAPDA